eukprot:1150689-Pelagomonas_calceolata.AAC.1
MGGDERERGTYKEVKQGKEIIVHQPSMYSDTNGSMNSSSRQKEAGAGPARPWKLHDEGCNTKLPLSLVKESASCRVRTTELLLGCQAGCIMKGVLC